MNDKETRTEMIARLKQEGYEKAIANVNTINQKNRRMRYWEDIIEIDFDDSEWRSMTLSDLAFGAKNNYTAQDVDEHIHTRYVEQLKDPKIQAKILGANI